MIPKSQTSKVFLAIMVIILGLSACTNPGSSGSVGLFVPKASQTLTPAPTETPLPPTATLSPTETPLPTATATPEMVEVPAGQNLVVPILMYHHIAVDGSGNRYFVSPTVFDAQMKWLYDHHYQTITVAQLADLILNGGSMPKRPVVITFDDGDEDMVQNALPILKKYHFNATAFLIVTWINAPGYITKDQVMDLIGAGWEIGSHSMSHVDLTQSTDTLSYEVRESRTKLNQLFDLNVTSFAYPFGLIDSNVANSVANNGYTAGVGLGVSYTHGLYDLYYLSRLEVRQSYSMDQFVALLPWQD
jgi:peptidoglycan/xylan/chitin deacetylase (PgdA/CDA1 family)